MRPTPFAIVALVATVAGAGIVSAADRPSLVDRNGTAVRADVVDLRGDLEKPAHLSGIASVGRFLLVVSDEARNPTVVQVLERDGNAYRVVRNVRLPGGTDEVDLEAVAAEGSTIYVTGSHASTRKTDEGRVGEVSVKPSREQFFRFTLSAEGNAENVQGPKSLGGAIRAHAVLKGFVRIPSKENGIDIEGLAVKDGRLYFGFRGPVLRGAWVPVVSTTWDDPDRDAKVRYVNLDGRGIRDLVAVDGGFLILAGPVGDGDGSYRIYFWDGADQLPGGDNGPRPDRLGEFTDLDDAKPEGLAVVGSQGKTYDILVVLDGLKSRAMGWKIRRP
jgi:hypothetical protein